MGHIDGQGQKLNLIRSTDNRRIKTKKYHELPYILNAEEENKKQDLSTQIQSSEFLI